MSANGERAPTQPADDNEQQEDESFDPAEYDALLQLERLESLEEDMLELGVTTLEEVRQRIATLHREIEIDE
jgi:hypothetical protein